MKIGVLSPASIARNRFLPALLNDDFFELAGVATYSEEERFDDEEIDSICKRTCVHNSEKKARDIVDVYNGRVYPSYQSMINDPQIEAIYIPLPPAFHYQWVIRAMEKGKHCFVEKPFTTNLSDTLNIIRVARLKKIAVHENYMFVFHSQLHRVMQIIKDGAIGNVRLYIIRFGFPRRPDGDFRYKKKQGGGAFLDAGGYTLCLASILLGESISVLSATLNNESDSEVDIYGSGSLVNSDGLVAQIAFGMDNQYKCELQAWGSKGELTTSRIFTAPPDLKPEIILNIGNERIVETLEEDDSFQKSIGEFKKSVLKKEHRETVYSRIEHQARLMDEFLNKAILYK